MHLDCQVAHSVAEIDPEAWDRLSQGRPFASYRWYRYGETVMADTLPVYVLVSQAGEPVARATFWLRTNEPLPISAGPIRTLVEALMARWPLLICQAPLADESGLILPDPPLRDEALARIAEVALEQAERHGASFVAFVYLGPEESRLAGWPVGFAAAELPEPGTCLSLAWPDFESYLRSLPRSARKNYRRNCNRAADQGVEVVSQPTVTDLDEAMRLIGNVEQRHGSPPYPWARAALEHAHMVEATWLAARVGGRLVGCGSVLGEGDARFLKFLGLDYGVSYAYFQLVYAGIRCAIEQGVRVLVGGAGAYETKQRLGFQLVDTNYVAFAGRGPVLGRLGRWLVGKEESKVRDPYES